MNKLKVDKRGIPFETASGRLVYPLDLDPEDVDLGDIAYSLSNLCRFGGHTNRFYSVAEHSVRVSQKCLKKDALTGLLHDASEAYLVDLPRPVKVYLSEYRQYEEKVQRVIAGKFGITWPYPASVYEADHRLLVTEMRDLMTHYINEGLVIKPYKEIIDPMTPSQSRRAFLARYKELTTHDKRKRNNK